MGFLQEAEAHGLIIRDLIADGNWHRVPTVDHRKKRNGAYRLLGDIGFVQNHATDDRVTVWRDGSKSEHVDRAKMRAISAQAARDTLRRQETARQEASAIIQACQRGRHPYLARKGFPESLGLIHGDDLIIPMREFSDYGMVNGVQRIQPDGAKLFLPGTKAKNSVFVIGKGAKGARYLVEGYCTGLSVQAALLDLRRQCEVIVCFSAGNLQHVANTVKRSAFVVADNDESGTGRRAAEATGLPWVMPATIGTDGNDLHQQQGLRALVALIR